MRIAYSPSEGILPSTEQRRVESLTRLPVGSISSTQHQEEHCHQGGDAMGDKRTDIESGSDETVAADPHRQQPQSRESSSKSKNTEAESIGRQETRHLLLLKSIVVSILACAAIIVACLTYHYTRKYEIAQFNYHFQRESRRLTEHFENQEAIAIWIGAAYSVSFTAASVLGFIGQIFQFPYLTLPSFESKAFEYAGLDMISQVAFAPLLNSTTQLAWESFSQSLIEDNAPDHQVGWPNRSYTEGIYELDDQYQPVNVERNDTIMPIWQFYPPQGRKRFQFFDQFSDPIRRKPLETMIAEKKPAASAILNADTERTFNDEYDGPLSVSVVPVLDSTPEKNVVGAISIEQNWLSIFKKVSLEDCKSHVVVVMENSCGDVLSFDIMGGEVHFLGATDQHDPDFDDQYVGSADYGVHTRLKAMFVRVGVAVAPPEFMELFMEMSRHPNTQEADHLERTSDGSRCGYTIKVYPTKDFRSVYVTKRPAIFTVSAILIFVFASAIFFTYDRLVEKRQRKVLDAAVKSRKIVYSLFPRMVRERLFGGSQEAIESRFLVRLSPKIRLTQLLKNDSESEGRDRDLYLSDNPIAEVFLNTSVIFADIAGFTAWSSEREPSRVFQLLEVVWSGFDIIAKRLNVFKVETIGDCFVAVTGLPDPNENHAVAMAYFAAACMSTMSEITKSLECVLGPGTSDLRIRVGIHSGPVTAGVLRNEKSRFQLFGDTMNVASRMECSSSASKIHISQTTADLIADAGYSRWIVKRTEMVDTKGKGQLQTFWCEPDQGPPEKNTFVSQNNQVPSIETVVDKRAAFNRGKSREWRNLDICDYSEFADVEMVDEVAKHERLIDWNTDVLLGLLAKVLYASNGKVGRYQRKTESFSRVTEPNNPSILSHVKNGVALPKFRVQTPAKHSEIGISDLDPQVRRQLRDYVAKIASLYRCNDFHNFEHASHVALSASKLMKRIIAPEDLDYSREKLESRQDIHAMESALHYSTFGISSDPLTQFCVVLSALVHDADHTGVTNQQLVKEGDPVAVHYNNTSVAEQHSVHLALSTLAEPRYSILAKCIYGNSHEEHRFRELLINLVMATDIVDKELQSLRKNRWQKAFHATKDSPMLHSVLESVDINRKATVVLEHIIQASDVAHTMQHWHIYCKWNEKLFEEMHTAYLAGRATKNPAQFWYKGEIGFFDNYIIPLAKKLKECGVFGVSSDEYLQYAVANREEWIEKGEAIVTDMVRKRTEVLA